MQKTGIEWTTLSANPLKYRDAAGKVAHGCVKTSPGCQACYAEAIAQRFGKGGPFTAARQRGLTPFLDGAELRKMLTYKPAAGKRCFVGDMTDVFGAWVPDELLDRLFAVFALRPDVTWQVLTKRAERMADYVSGLSRGYDRLESAARSLGHTLRFEGLPLAPWPIPGVWLGVSVEDQARKGRIDVLRHIPAAVRFLSLEPLLEDLGALDLGGIHWAIIGGESGAGARPCNLAWVRSLVAQCREAGCPAFVKQLGANIRGLKRGGLDHDAIAVALGSTYRLRDPKGGDPSEWPNDLRVREFPEAAP